LTRRLSIDGEVVVSRTKPEIIANIRAFQPDTDLRELMRGWKTLADLVGELEAAGWLAETIPEVLAVFERYPEARPLTWAWDVVKALEWLPGRYEQPMIESILRRPSRFTVSLAFRALARGKSEVGGIPLLDLLTSVVSRADVPESVRRLTESLVQQARQSPA
jgi:hypothetical protein